MSETIYKLEPHRTLHLRGVDRFGAAGSLWGCSATGFSCSGVFRDMADFMVLMLWDADDYFGHYQCTKYMPDFNFSNMVLTFDIAMSGLQQLDSPANQWIPWRSLSYVLQDGQPGTIDLSTHVTQAGGTLTAASATITIVDSSPVLGDRVTLWYQNDNFDYTIPASVSVSFGYFNFFGTGYNHTLTIGSNTYSHIQLSTDGSGDIAIALALAASGDPNATATPSANNVILTPTLNTGASVTCSASDGNGPDTLWEATAPATLIATKLTAQINAFNFSGYALGISATSAGAAITVTCTVPGGDGNSITMYAIYSGGASATPAIAPFSGGVSGATWAVSIDFSALGINSLKQAWLTFAPQIQYTGVAYASTEWSVAVTNWAVSDPSTVRPLKIAGPGSVRIGSRDAWTTYAGSSWIEEASNQPGGTGWFNKGFAHRMSTPGDSVTVQYACSFTHSLYVGTSLYTDRGIVAVSIDGGASANLDCYYNAATEPVVTSRILNGGTAIAAGKHTVTFTLQSSNHTALGGWDSNSSGTFFYFDYLVAAVLSDVPSPAVTYSKVMPATDFDTDHAYRLSPERLIWMLTNLGYAGEINHYLGVFWWNQRTRVGGSFPVATVTFGGTWNSGDIAIVIIGGETIEKTVFPADTLSSIAAHFSYYINELFTGVQATVSGAVLTITCRTPEFSFTLSASPSGSNTGTGTVGTSGSLTGGTEGSWVIDDTVTPVINRAVTDWHTDFWAQVAAAGLTGVASFSMELVNPPDATGHVYAQRFIDGTEVLTDTGFGGLNSTQCTFNATFRAYQQEAFKEMAGLMHAAGLVPYLQFGEFLWWYFALAQNVQIGFASFTAPISIGTTVPHGLSTGQKVLQTGVLGNTAANGGPFTITVVDPTHYTLNGTSGNGTYTGGGTVTGGSMAYYDADTASAAVTALGRSLATFSYPTDNPAVNSHADANFLRALIFAHTSAIATFVQATYPTAQFEVLWPYDVNYPTPTALADLGGAMNRYVNLPSQWQTLSGSGLVRMKMEALAFGSTERSLTLALQALSFPSTSPLTWPLADTAYLIPVFNGGCPWPLEFLATLSAVTPNVNFWAFDHFCLLSWPMLLPTPGSSAQIMQQ